MLDDNGTDSEIDQLARTFNSLHARLISEKAEREKLETWKNDLTNMLIHDMKQPITVLSSVLAILLDEAPEIGRDRISLAVVRFDGESFLRYT